MDYQQSEKIDQLATALIKAKAKFPPIPKNGFNPHFNSHFSTYNDISTVDPILAEYGLCVSHDAISSGDTVGVRTMLMHVSGQFKSSVLSIKPSRPGPQEAGSIITYFKRYGKGAALGIEGEIDDDGNSASNVTKTPSQTVAKPVPSPQSAAPAREVKPNPAKAGEPISEAQGKRLFAICSKSGWTQADLKEALHIGWHIDSTKKILRSDYEEICNMVERVTPAVAIAKLKEDLHQNATSMGTDPYYAPPTDKDAPSFEEIPF